jgi:hypothetical protein
MDVGMCEVVNPRNRVWFPNLTAFEAGDVLLKARPHWLEGKIDVYVNGVKMERKN